MSRVGRVPIKIVDNVNVEIGAELITFKGPKGELSLKAHPKIEVVKEDQQIVVKKKTNDKQAKSLHGLYQRLISNYITGVSQGYEKKLELKGVGYRASAQNNVLNLVVGYSHPVEIKMPEGIEVKVQKNIITISGIDKQKVGQIAAEIRAIRKPEPYKGKGIKYIDEVIKRKAGKAAKAAGAGA